MKKHIWLHSVTLHSVTLPSVISMVLLLGCVSANAAQAPVKAPVPSATTVQTTSVSNANLNVTIDFPDAEVVDIYHVLGDMAGWNVIADPSVKGKFAVSLKNEPLSRALDLVAGATGYGYVLVGNTLVVAAPERLKTFAKHELAVLNVNSLAPETAKALIEAAAPGVVVTLDNAQRLILVSGAPEQVLKATTALSRYDVPAAKEFEFVDQPVSDILRALAKNAGMSVILEGNLNARLTMYIKDLSPHEAIKLVAERAGVQQDVTASGVMVFRPAGVAAVTPDKGPVADSQVYKLKYLPVATASEMVSTLYPSLEVKTGAAESFLIIKGLASELDAAFAFLARQDFPSLRLVGVVQHDKGVMAVLEIAGRSFVVREGQTIDDLVIEALTANSITVRRGERREVITAGGVIN